MVTPKKSIGQEGDGSPAQIWAELDRLASRILGKNKLAFADRFESLNDTAVSLQRAAKLREFKDPAAECMAYSDTTQHNTTQHNAMMG